MRQEGLDVLKRHDPAAGGLRPARYRLLRAVPAERHAQVDFRDIAAGRLPLIIGVVPTESNVPMMMFAIIFGLSMGYEIFLLSRLHEPSSSATTSWSKCSDWASR